MRGRKSKLCNGTTVLKGKRIRRRTSKDVIEIGDVLVSRIESELVAVGLIHAVKLCRDATGLSLTDAVDVVEVIRGNGPRGDPTWH